MRRPIVRMQEQRNVGRASGGPETLKRDLLQQQVWVEFQNIHEITGHPCESDSRRVVKRALDLTRRRKLK